VNKQGTCKIVTWLPILNVATRGFKGHISDEKFFRKIVYIVVYSVRKISIDCLSFLLFTIIVRLQYNSIDLLFNSQSCRVP